MGMDCAGNPHNMDMTVLQVKVSFKMGLFSGTQHTHLDICMLELPPPPPPPPVPRVERDKDGLPAITGFSVFVFGHGSLGSKLHMTCFILVYFVCACSITFLSILQSLHTKIKIDYSQGLSRL